MTPRALTVRGTFRGPSGHDHHVREFVRALHGRGMHIELIDIPRWLPVRLPEALRDPWFDTLAAPVGARVVLHCCMPHQAVPERGRINVNYTMFEATRIPAQWVAAHRGHDLVILPTESSRSAWIASGVPAEQIRLCPLGIDAVLYARRHDPLPLRDELGSPIGHYRTRFLNVSELGPRKNLLGLLRTWIRATVPSDDAVLIVKLGRYMQGRFERFQRQLAELEVQLGSGLEGAAPVLFLYDLLADTEMPRLYAAATHYISMSFGEGWDQAMLEAGAAGLSLIAPDHSAYTAYLDSTVARLIRSREVPARFEGDAELQTLFAHANWWEPNEDEAMTAIRAAMDGRAGGTTPARERILRDFTWDAAADRLIAALSEAEARAG